MPGKLQAVSGPLRDSEYQLDPRTTIGRDPGSTICLDDPSVSAAHCVIDNVDGRLVLTDLDTPSGTFVNGLPVKQRVITSGDEIAVGNTLFLVLAEHPARNHANGSFQISDHQAGPADPVAMDAAQPFALDSRSLSALPPADRTARNLSALIYICRGIASLRDEESLPWQLLSMIFDVIPADRGAVLLLEKDSQEVQSHVAWDRAGGPDHPVHVSREVVQRVAAGESLWQRASQEKRTPYAWVCLPIVARDNTVGIVYLESDSDVTAPTEADFRLLSAIAGLGAVALESARQIERLGSENQRLRAEATLTHDMVGRSPRMREVFQFIERVAATDSTVLVYGESGTGKELVASAIHKNSSRKHQPFVALNCAAITETLLESELFGHEKGAFTSAISQKKGYLEVADGGTIFLDEIGELSLILQAKLLRVLQEREFVRVGGTRPIKINVRFLAATNKDLQKLAREEKFRPDLFHRLNVISINLPALRDRRDDIPFLAEHFVARHAATCGRRLNGISREAMACLTAYDWPGNIRELENALERAAVIGSSDRILAEDLPEAVLESAKPDSATAASDKYHDAVRSLKKQLILGALDQSSGNITEAAKLLGVHANYLHRLMRNLELRPLLKKQGAD